MTDTSLTVEAAVEALDSAPEAPETEETTEQPGAETSDDETEAESQPADGDDDEEAEEAPDVDDEDDEKTVEAGTLEAPQFWDAEDKAWFAALDANAQAKILKQEAKREAVVQKAKSEAQASRKAADDERQGVQSVKAALETALPQVVAAFNEYWGPQGFDLEANVKEYGAETALLLQDRYQKESKALSEVLVAKEKAELDQKLTFQREQRELLKEVCPELVDPKDGKQREKELAGYLIENGAGPDDLTMIPAWAVKIALNGMKYERAQAAAIARKTEPKPAPTPGAKPSASAPVPSQTRTVQKAQNRFAQTRSIDDAVAVLDLKG